MEWEESRLWRTYGFSSEFGSSWQPRPSRRSSECYSGQWLSCSTRLLDPMIMEFLYFLLSEMFDNDPFLSTFFICWRDVLSCLQWYCCQSLLLFELNFKTRWWLIRKERIEKKRCMHACMQACTCVFACEWVCLQLKEKDAKDISKHILLFLPLVCSLFVKMMNLNSTIRSSP